MPKNNNTKIHVCCGPSHGTVEKKKANVLRFEFTSQGQKIPNDHE
jgi:hypothetical protein